MTRTIVTTEIRERIIALAREGRSNREIEAVLQVPSLQASYIAAVLTRARRDGYIIPYRSKAWETNREDLNAQLTALTVKLDQGSVAYLNAIGAARGIEPAYMAGILIEAIARDRLADAVLDDGVRYDA